MQKLTSTPVRTLTANATLTLQALAKRKLVSNKTVTWRGNAEDSIAAIRVTVLAESISLTDAESLLCSDALQAMLKIKNGTTDEPAREFTETEQVVYGTALELLQRAALPFMVDVLIKRVTRFESPEAALSAMWRESALAVSRWIPRYSPTRFQWFITETFKKSISRVAADDEGYRHRKERISTFVALLKGFDAMEHATAMGTEGVEYEGRFNQYASLDAEDIFNRLVLEFGEPYLKNPDGTVIVNKLGEPVKDENSPFWKQPFTSVEIIQSVINDMQLLLNPLSIQYQTDPEMGTLADTLSYGDDSGLDLTDEEIRQVKEDEDRMFAFENVLKQLAEQGITQTMLERHSAAIHDYLESIVNLDDTKAAMWLGAIQMTSDLPDHMITPITKVMLPFYREYA